MSASVWKPGTALVPALPAVSPISFVPGTSGNPGINFVGYTGSGIWSESSGSVDVSVNGAHKAKFDAAGLTLKSGKLTTAPELTLPSAATIDLGAVASNTVQITGANDISSFGTTYRGPMFVRFAAALQLNNSGNLILPGATNIVVQAGDTCTVMPKATAGVSDGWIVTEYTRASVSPPLVGYAVAGANSDITSLSGLVSINGGPLSGLRNKIIGGHFSTAPMQRGTTFTVTVTNTYVAENWLVQFDGTANITVARVALPTPALINGIWCSTGLKVTVNSKAGNTYIRLVHRIEGSDVFTTSNAVLQTAIQASATLAVPVNLRQSFGTGGAPSADVITPFTTTLAATASMQWLQTGVLAPNISGKTLGTTLTSDYIAVEYDLLAIPVSGYVILALSGLEQGSFATLWEDRRRIELSLAQRYYQKSYLQGIYPGTAAAVTDSVTGSWASVTTATIGGITSSFPVVMRAAPALTLYDLAGTAGVLSYLDAGGSTFNGLAPNSAIATDSRVNVRLYNGASAVGIAFNYQVVADL